MARIESSNFKLNLSIESIDFAEEQKGNPYNSICAFEIYSDGFYGKTKITTSSKYIAGFISDLKNMYKSLKGNTRLSDFDYGTNLHIKCDKLGFFIFNGIVINESFHQLKFENRLDQTYLQDFIRELADEFDSSKNM